MTSQNALDLIKQVVDTIAFNKADHISIYDSIDLLQVLVDNDMAPKDEPIESIEKQPEPAATAETNESAPAEQPTEQPAENKDVAASVVDDTQPQAPIDGPAAQQGPVNL